MLIRIRKKMEYRKEGRPCSIRPSHLDSAVKTTKRLSDLSPLKTLEERKYNENEDFTTFLKPHARKRKVAKLFMSFKKTEA